MEDPMSNDDVGEYVFAGGFARRSGTSFAAAIHAARIAAGAA
jgi:hypothetical protein